MALPYIISHHQKQGKVNLFASPCYWYKYFKGRKFRETEKSRNFADLSFAIFTFWRKFMEETFEVFCECSIIVAIIFSSISFFTKLTFAKKCQNRESFCPRKFLPLNHFFIFRSLREYSISSPVFSVSFIKSLYLAMMQSL